MKKAKSSHRNKIFFSIMSLYIIIAIISNNILSTKGFANWDKNNDVPSIVYTDKLLREKIIYNRIKTLEMYRPKVENENISETQTKPQYTYITDFNNFDLRIKSNISQEVLKEYLNKYPALSDFDLDKTLIEIENKLNVNAIFLLAIIRLESGNGTSDVTNTMNNLGGVTFTNQSEYAKFNTKIECVWHIGQLLSEDYLNASGVWYGGGFTVKDVCVNYNGNNEWAESILCLMEEIQEGVLEII